VIKKKTLEITPEEIKAIRAKLDLTQHEMSLMMHMAAQTISKWELGSLLKVDRWRKNYIYLCAHAYINGDLSEYGELKKEFVDFVDKS